MEENNKIVVTREYEKKMSEISPFELKDILIRLADESARKSTHIMLNAGRGRRYGRSCRRSPETKYRLSVQGVS